MPFPSPRDLPDPGMEPKSPIWQVDSLPLSHLGSPFIPNIVNIYLLNKQKLQLWQNIKIGYFSLVSAAFSRIVLLKVTVNTDHLGIMLKGRF